MSSSSMLGTPAVRQIIAKLNKSDKEEQMLIEKIASSCHKFDHKGKVLVRIYLLHLPIKLFLWEVSFLGFFLYPIQHINEPFSTYELKIFVSHT